MNKQIIVDSLGVDLNNTVAKIEKVMAEKGDVQHNSMEELVIEFTKTLVDILTPTEMALILSLKTIEDFMSETIAELFKGIKNQQKEQNNPLSDLLGL